MPKGREVPAEPQLEHRVPAETRIERNRATRNYVRETVVETLETDKTLPTVDRVIREAAELATLMVETYATGEKVACQAGCWWCCSFTYIAASAPEVLRIAEYLREHRSPAELATLGKRLAQREERIRGMSEERRKYARIPCALLVDNRCSVYAVRPLSCRGATSSDAAACESSYRSGWTRPIPNGPRHLGITVDIRDGVGEGLERVGLDGEDLDLTIALRIALETPDAGERWLAGEPVFAPAYMR